MASKAKTMDTQRLVWPLALVIALILGVILLRPYLGVSALGLLFAFIFYPWYEAFKRWTKRGGLAILLTTVASLFTVAIPLVIVISITVAQALNLANDISQAAVNVDGINFVEELEEATIAANERIESWLGVKDVIQSEDIESFLQSTIPAVIGAVRDILLGVVSGIPNFFTMLIVYLFVFTAALGNAKGIRSTLEILSPFDQATNKRYLARLGSMAKAMLKGQLVIALMQGVASAAVLALIGFSSYFLVFAVIFTFLSFIPLGAGIVTIPLGIILMLIGDIPGGLLVLLNHFVVVTNIDNIVRPMLVPKDAQLPAVLTILSAFGGVSTFGFIGVVYGPMIMIFITTTIESYGEYKKKQLAA